MKTVDIINNAPAENIRSSELKLNPSELIDRLSKSIKNRKIIPKTKILLTSPMIRVIFEIRLFIDFKSPPAFFIRIVAMSAIVI